MSADPKTMPARPQPIPLLQLLANLRGGAIVQEVQEELERVNKAVTLLGKNGKVTVAFNIRPAGDVPGAVFFEAEISSKVPKPKRGADMFFSGMDGGFHRNDPRQMEFSDMKPRVVGGVAFDPKTGLILGQEDRASA